MKKYFCEVKYCSREENLNYYVKIALQKFLKFESILIDDKYVFVENIEKIKEEANYYLKNSNRQINVAVVDMDDFISVFIADHKYNMLFQFCLHGIKNS